MFLLLFYGLAFCRLNYRVIYWKNTWSAWHRIQTVLPRHTLRTAPWHCSFIMTHGYNQIARIRNAAIWESVPHIEPLCLFQWTLGLHQSTQFQNYAPQRNSDYKAQTAVMSSLLTPAPRSCPLCRLHRSSQHGLPFL